MEIPILDITNALAWTGIVIHHSATKDGNLNDWEGIRKFHTSYRLNGDIISKDKARELTDLGEKRIVKPWTDIGYHFGLERVGGDLQVQVGRPLSKTGAHAVGFNHTHIGVCIVGNFDKAAPEKEVLDCAARLVRNIMYTFRLSHQAILGHRETFALRGVPVEKTCPGTLWDMTEFRQLV